MQLSNTCPSLGRLLRSIGGLEFDYPGADRGDPQRRRASNVQC
jgi:hypothetical protein